MGGLSKKAFQLEAIRQAHPLPSLTLDGGSLLFKTKRVTPSLAAQAKITAGGIIDAYNLMEYHAVGISRYDLAGGLPFLNQMSDRAEFPLLSANLVNKSTGKSIFIPKVIRHVGALAIGIIGIVDSESPSPFTVTDDAGIVPWHEVLPGLVAELAPDCDMIILLSNQKLIQNKKIVQTVPGIHLIIQTGVGSPNLAPIKIDNTLIVQTAKQGKYLGWLKINWLPSREWADNTLKEDLALKKRELAAVRDKYKNSQTSEGPEGAPREGVDHNPALKTEQLLNEIRRLEAAIVQRDLEHPTSTYENHFIALDIVLPDNPQVQAVVERTKQQLNALKK